MGIQMNIYKDKIYKEIGNLIITDDPKSSIKKIVKLIWNIFPNDSFHIPIMVDNIDLKWRVEFISRVHDLIRINLNNEPFYSSNMKKHVNILLRGIEIKIEDSSLRAARKILNNIYKKCYDDKSIPIRNQLIEFFQVLDIDLAMVDIKIESADWGFNILFDLLYEVDNLLMMEKYNRHLDELIEILKS